MEMSILGEIKTPTEIISRIQAIATNKKHGKSSMEIDLSQK
jgi:hypothetical protein